MTDSRRNSRLWLTVWLALLCVLPLARYFVHRQQVATDDAYDAAQNRIQRNSHDLVEKIDSFVHTSYAEKKRRPTLLEVEKQFNDGKPMPKSTKFPGDFELTDDQEGAYVAIEIRSGEYVGAVPDYPLMLRPRGVDEPMVYALVWISRAADLLLLASFIWMWLNRSELSQSRTTGWGWRIAAFSVLTLVLSMCGAYRSTDFELELARNSICLEPLVPILVLLLLPALCLRDFPIDLARRCDKCDYNLKGNVSGICPECGAKILGTVRRSKRSGKELI